MLIEFSKQNSKTDAEYVLLIQDKHDKAMEEFYHLAKRYFKNSFHSLKSATIIQYTIKGRFMSR